MSTTVYHVDQNVIIIVDDDSQGIHFVTDNFKDKRTVQRLNKEKLKVLLQISGCKASHSFQVSERIFEHIFSNLIENYRKKGDQDFDKSQQATLTQTVLVSEKYFQDIVLAEVCEKRYMRERKDYYLEEFQIARTLTGKRDPLIILLGGTSGTGKSTVSSILASRFGISTVLSSDSIRHIIRNFLSKEDNAVLFASTYEAGKYLNTEEILSENQRIIKGYKFQCRLVQAKLEHVIKKFNDSNDTIIIEGVHLTPLFMFQIMKKYRRVLPFALSITKESKHKERFAVRSKYMTLNPGNNKYIENFPRIRLIQKWFLEKADEYLIPKVDNANIDKSIELIHKTIMNYLKKLQKDENDVEAKSSFSELKNALPLYEEYNKVNKNIWSTKELKDYINTQVDKTEIYENFLLQINESQRENNMREIDIEQMRSNASNAPNNPRSENEYSTQLSVVSGHKNMVLQATKKRQKELLQQSVQKFNEISSKNEKVQEQNSALKTGEGNFIVEGEIFDGKDVHHLSGDEEQNRSQFTDEPDSKVLKKAKSLKQLPQLLDQKVELVVVNNETIQQPLVQLEVSLSQQVQLQKYQEPDPILYHSQEDEDKITSSKKKVKFLGKTDEVIEKARSGREEEETTPQKIDYKGILQHLSKHKRLFLSKKTKAQSIEFIKKMIQNYNANYKSKHNNDKIRLIQNADGSYCMYKIKQQNLLKSKKLHQSKNTSEGVEEIINSSSDQEDNSECLSSINQQARSLLIPFSEKQISDGDSVRFLPDQDSDNEAFEGGDENADSVEASDSSEDEQGIAIQQLGVVDNEDDSFELHKINEEEIEFEVDEK